MKRYAAIVHITVEKSAERSAVIDALKRCLLIDLEIEGESARPVLAVKLDMSSVTAYDDQHGFISLHIPSGKMDLLQD